MKAAGELLWRPSAYRRDRRSAQAGRKWRRGQLTDADAYHTVGGQNLASTPGDGAFLTRVPFHAIPRHKRGGS
jgi:hypothetical protein